MSSKILIVDDSPTIRKMIAASLRPIAAELGEAANGLEAIEKLVVQGFDVMTLDLNMPDMHGLEVIRFVRGHDAFRSLPIVVLSTRSDAEARAEAMAAGANDYLSKPFTRESLLAAVRSALEPKA